MFKITTFLTLIIFSINCFSAPLGLAQTLVGTGLLPEPGVMLTTSSQVFTPSHIQAITIDQTNPFNFTFLMHKGDVEMSSDEKKATYTELIKYFLTSLTIPDENQWVNLSPYEGDRLIEHHFGLTHMGRELLAQDYLLKQLTASLLHPDLETGKKFWEEIYRRANEAYGTTDIPVDTFNKVWIVPDEAVVVEKDTTAYLISQRLRVLTERDYIAMKEAENQISPVQKTPLDPNKEEIAILSSNVMREVIVPVIEKEINESQTFAGLRQICSAMILATWYKRALKETVLGEKYANKAKVEGVNQDPSNNEKIYQQYLQAFQKGVFNMIREDVDVYSQEIIPRKYFSGGLVRSKPGDDSSQISYYSMHLEEIPLAMLDVVKKGVESIFLMLEKKDLEAVNAQMVNAMTMNQEALFNVTKDDDRLSIMNTLFNRLFTMRYSTQEDALKAFKDMWSVEIGEENPNEDIAYWEKWIDVEQREDGWHIIPSGQWFRQNFSYINPYTEVYESWVNGLLNMNRNLRLPLGLEISYKDLLEIGLNHAANNQEQFNVFVETTFTDRGDRFERATRKTYYINQTPEDIQITVKRDVLESLRKTQLLSEKDLADIKEYFNVAIMPSESFSQKASVAVKITTTDPAELLKPQQITPALLTALTMGNIKQSAVNQQIWATSQVQQDLKKYVSEIAEKGASSEAFLESVLDKYPSLKSIRGFIIPALKAAILEASFLSPIAFAVKGEYDRVQSEREKRGVPGTAGISLKEIPLLDQNKDFLRINGKVTEPTKSNTQGLPVYYIGTDHHGFNKKPNDFYRFSAIVEGYGTKVLVHSVVELTTDSSQGEKKVLNEKPANNLYGGIDLNAVNLNLQIKRDGSGVPLPVTIEDLENFQINGLVPKIISIEPAQSLPFLNQLVDAF